MDRRQFILSGIALGAASSLGIYGWNSSFDENSDNRDLVLSALLPALLYAALPEDTTMAVQVNRTKAAISDFMPYLAKRQQQELQQLFNLLANQVTQLALTGHLTAISELTMSQRWQLLANWRDSYLALLQQAYHGLRELLFAAYYGQPEHWQAINYTAPRYR
ncbi:hypothetical protein [Rheinheimera salexigens]|uniref:TAT leader-containing periplasmic protein n=1 Tax=Rheinheimera salexigens TaxID=1628148 RepID=A0A1E7Q1U8_9GAMM|nr:hypothetical protein [Rheinheimera salexigens]OEY68184.1 hypothetical protein BI198_00345 [Rheinheimera salexigens]